MSAAQNFHKRQIKERKILTTVETRKNLGFLLEFLRFKCHSTKMSFWTEPQNLILCFSVSFSHLPRPLRQEVWSSARESQRGGHELHHSRENGEYPLLLFHSWQQCVCAVAEGSCETVETYFSSPGSSAELQPWMKQFSIWLTLSL